MMPYKISFIGAGNLAASLCMELYNKGFLINHIISKTGVSAKALAQKCNSSWSTELLIPENTDIVLVAIPDRTLKDVLHNVVCNNDTLIAHTAGSFGLEVFNRRFLHTGVFYPLQTFSNNRKLLFNEIPIFIEASDTSSGLILESVGKQIGKTVRFSDSSGRTLLHLSAVFINNFTNHILTEGKEIALRAGFSFEDLIPLLNETVKKACEIGPENAQTGPAVRNDMNTLKKHLDLLSFSPELSNIYQELSNSIIKRYNK